MPKDGVKMLQPVISHDTFYILLWLPASPCPNAVTCSPYNKRKQASLLCLGRNCFTSIYEITQKCLNVPRDEWKVPQICKWNRKSTRIIYVFGNLQK